VTLSAPSLGTTIGTGTANGVILNDDSRIAIAATNASQTEGNSGSKAFTFTVTRRTDLPGGTSFAASANWAVTGTGGTAANAADFAGGVLPTGTVNFAAGETSKVITINVNGDSVVEPDEGFTVTLSAPAPGTTISSASANGSILNDDANLAIAATNADQTEGNSGNKPFTFTVTRGGNFGGASTAAWAVSGNGASAAAANDFAGNVLPSGTVSFAAGETSKVITINVAGDSVVEGDDGFAVTLSAASAGTSITTAAASGIIRNDDASLAIAATNADQAEGNSGNKAFTFTVTRSGSTAGASTANWAVTGSGSSAADAADFAGGVLPGGTVSFAAGETSKVITVNVNGDSLFEGDDGFQVTLSAPSAGTSLATAAASGIIRNDDASLAIAATNADQTEGNSGSKAFTFTVTRSGSTAGASTANWAVTGTGSTAANAADFAGGVLPSGTVSFAAGETSKLITINVNGDTVRRGMKASG
jgi:hypothetical protein